MWPERDGSAWDAGTRTMKHKPHRKSHRKHADNDVAVAVDEARSVRAEGAVPRASEQPIWDASPSVLTARLIQARQDGGETAPLRPGPTQPAAPDRARPDGTGSAAPDFEALGRNVGQFVEQGGRLAAAWFAPQDGPTAAAEGIAAAFGTLGKVATDWLADPARLAQAQSALSTQLIDLWSDSLKRFTGTPPGASKDTARDNRFSDPEWRDNPFFDFVRRAYLIGADWARDMVEGAESLDEPTRLRARFIMRQVASALSPSNFVLTNPELLRETIRENGANLLRGAQLLAQDIGAGGGELRIRQTDESRFELGVNVAVTPGKVVFRNDLIELLQYAPRTEHVLKRPLLIVPPWINKFYILDLNPAKSFIGYAVSQGLTVFVVSWVNPEARHADKGWDAYMAEGVYAALDAVERATGEREVAALGYCVGGTLLAATLAHMAARGDRRVSSATFLTTQVDFTRAGDLRVFTEPAQIAAVEAEMAQTGTLSGAKMAQAFNMLRPDDLIWSYVVNNYLKGKEPRPFDLLAWNADATRMARANHSFYLRECYGANALAAGRMVLGGERLDLGRVTVPLYNLATREDHIAPAPSVFDGGRRFGGPVRTVVAGSGHIAGVINPPAQAKYGYWTGPAPAAAETYEAWIARAAHAAGSWWPDWASWLRDQAPGTVPARQPGDGALPALGDAPGTYVRVRS